MFYHGQVIYWKVIFKRFQFPIRKNDIPIFPIRAWRVPFSLRNCPCGMLEKSGFEKRTGNREWIFL